MEFNKHLIGTRIMQRRKALGLTQEQLAEKTNISKNHLSSIERGKHAPTIELLFRLCNVTGETPDYYLIGKITEETVPIQRLIESLPDSSQKMAGLLLQTYLDNYGKLT